MAQTYEYYEEPKNGEESLDGNYKGDENGQSENNAFGFEIISWEIPEYHKHDRDHWWYVLMGVLGIAMLIYAVMTADFLFAIILVLGGLILVFNDARHPELISISLTTEGIIVGSKFYDYDEIEHFFIIYKPLNDLKRLYFQFKSSLKSRLSLPLHDVDPLFVRENLIKYLPENFENADEPRSEVLSRLLRL